MERETVVSPHSADSSSTTCSTGELTLNIWPPSNSAPSRYPYVCYLECDPGQPEFTVPEVLSLHTVTDPLLGPPYTHLRKPYK